MVWHKLYGLRKVFGCRNRARKVLFKGQSAIYHFSKSSSVVYFCRNPPWRFFSLFEINWKIYCLIRMKNYSVFSILVWHCLKKSPKQRPFLLHWALELQISMAPMGNEHSFSKLHWTLCLIIQVQVKEMHHCSVLAHYYNLLNNTQMQSGNLKSSFKNTKPKSHPACLSM